MVLNTLQHYSKFVVLLTDIRVPLYLLIGAQFPRNRTALCITKFVTLHSPSLDGGINKYRNRNSYFQGEIANPGYSICLDHLDRSNSHGYGHSWREILVCAILGSFLVTSQPRW